MYAKAVPDCCLSLHNSCSKCLSPGYPATGFSPFLSHTHQKGQPTHWHWQKSLCKRWCQPGCRFLVIASLCPRCCPVASTGKDTWASAEACSAKNEPGGLNSGKAGLPKSGGCDGPGRTPLGSSANWPFWGVTVPRKACTVICPSALNRCSPRVNAAPFLCRFLCSLSRITPYLWDTGLGVITLAAGQSKT